MSRRAADWARHARAALAERGHRAGGARSAVIDALAEQDGCTTAASLAEHLRAGGSRVGTASVYRALTALQDAGLVHALELGEGERRYELVHADGAHHHHVVCDRCGATTAFHDEALEQALAALAGRHAWRVGAHDVVLHGICPRCGRGG